MKTVAAAIAYFAVLMAVCLFGSGCATVGDGKLEPVTKATAKAALTAASVAAPEYAAEAAAVTLAESLDTQIDASQLKALLLSAVEALPESEQAELPTFFPAWRPGAAYAVSNKLQFAGQLYRVLQDHTSQMDWTPDTAVSLFAAIQPPGVVAEWVQPYSTNPYQTGDQVTYGGQTWTSTADNNVWEPGVYGWEVSE